MPIQYHSIVKIFISKPKSYSKNFESQKMLVKIISSIERIPGQN